MSAHRVADLITVVTFAAFGAIAAAVVVVGRGTRNARNPGTLQERMLDTKARQRALELANKE